MRIITEEPLKAYIKLHPDTETALKAWVKTVKNSDWKNFADIKRVSIALIMLGINIMSSISVATTIGWVSLSNSLLSGYILDLLELMKNMTRLIVLIFKGL